MNIKSQKNNVSAVVLGMGVNGLGVVRSLSKEGVKVYAFDEDRNQPAMATSLAVVKECPDVKHQAKALLTFLIEFSKSEGNCPVLFPCTDAHNEFLHRYRDQLKEYFRFINSEDEVMKKLLDKNGQYQLAQEHNVATAKTFSPKSIEEIDAISKKIQFPVIIKGLNPMPWRAVFGDQKVIVIKNAKELTDEYLKLFKTNLHTVIQEIIVGDDTRHYKFCAYINKDGKALLTFTLQKVRQFPCHFGIGSCVVSVFEPEVAEKGLQFMRDMGYRGIGSIEFKRDKRDEKLKMIELNARLWAQNSLATACGQNYPWVAYRDLIGEEVPLSSKFKEGIKWIASKEDRASFYGYFREGSMSFKTWFKSFCTGRRVWSLFNWDDPMPFLKETKFGFIVFIKVFKKFIGVFNQKQTNKINQFGNLHLHVIQGWDEFFSLRKEWNDILDNNHISNPFIRHEWLCSWWKGYGAEKKMYIVKFSENGRTLGFAPLMRYKTKLCSFPTEALGFISNHWTRMDFVIADKAKECMESLAEHIKSEKYICILAQMDCEGENVNVLEKQLKKNRISFTKDEKLHAYIPVKGAWREYFQSQSSNFRMDSNRKIKRLEKQGEIVFSRGLSKNGTSVDKIREVAQNSWQSRDNVNIVTTPEGRVFYDEIIKQWKGEGRLDFSILEVDGKPISYLVGVENEGCYYAFDTAYDKEFQKFSPGLIMHNHILKNTFDKGLKKFDFGYNASYKKRWSEEQIEMLDITVFPKTLGGQFFLILNTIKRFIKRRKEERIC